MGLGGAAAGGGAVGGRGGGGRAPAARVGSPRGRDRRLPKSAAPSPFSSCYPPLPTVVLFSKRKESFAWKWLAETWHPGAGKRESPSH